MSTQIFANLPVIETERLLLRKLRSEDAVGLFEMLSDPLVTKYTPREPHQSIEETQSLLQQWISQHERNEVSRWGMVHKSDSKLIGLCGFISWDTTDKRAEIAYISARKYWGWGYMTEAVREVISFGFQAMGLNRIEALCEPENISSIRVLEKAGMYFEGKLREYKYDKEAFHTVSIYSILKHEWEQGVKGHL
jgi:[ribosomal protein S5]-alanine N-acetyltransferase